MIHSSFDNILTIDLKGIVDNYATVKNSLNKDTNIAVVVKANAYGYGVREIAIKLSSLGCSRFFVATLEEALELRSFSLTDEIYVLNGIARGQEEHFFIQNIIPVINSYDEFLLWSIYAQRKGVNMPCLFQLDTGLNRLGISLKEFNKIVKDTNINNLRILYVITHLSTAYKKDSPSNLDQLNKLKSIKKILPETPLSIANSGGAYLGEEYHLDLVRIGNSIFGHRNCNPAISKKFVSLKASIIHKNYVEEDCYVGYEQTAFVKAGTKLATIGIGYADGIPRNATGKGYCFIADVKVPFVGRVSMDTITIDVTHISDKEVYIGAEVEMIGKNCSIEDVANYSGCYSNEIMLNIGKRVRRKYIDTN